MSGNAFPNVPLAPFSSNRSEEPGFTNRVEQMKHSQGCFQNIPRQGCGQAFERKHWSRRLTDRRFQASCHRANNRLRSRFVRGEPCHRNVKILHQNYECEIMSAKIIFIAREVRGKKALVWLGKLRIEGVEVGAEGGSRAKARKTRKGVIQSSSEESKSSLLSQGKTFGKMLEVPEVSRYVTAKT